MSGSRRSRTTQSKPPGLEGRERVAAGSNGDDVDVVVAEQLADAQLFGGIVLDDEQALATRPRVFPDAFERDVQAFGARGLR